MHACARRLGVSAPTLSYSMKQLERVAGVELFIRSKAGVKLTDSGEYLMKFCSKYFQDFRDLEDILLKPTLNLKRKIKVGTFQSIAIYFWPLIVESFRDSPDINLSIMTHRSAVIHEALIQKEIELALTVEASQQRGVIRHELYKDDYGMYASRLVRGHEITEKTARRKSFLYIPDAVDKDGMSLREHYRGWGTPFKDEFEMDSFEVVAEFIKKDFGIGVLPQKVANGYKKFIKPVKLSSMDSPYFGTHRFHLSYRDDLDLPQSVMNSFLKASEKAVKDLKFN